MMRREGLAHRPLGACFEPLAPQAVMPVSGGGEVQRLAVRRPLGPIFRIRLLDRNPDTFANRFRSIGGCDRNAAAIWRIPNRKTYPAVVGREPAEEQRVT